MADIIVTENEIVCPRGGNDQEPIIVNLREILKIENRIQEVQMVNSTKAPELLSSFTVGWKDLYKHIVLLIHEKNVASNMANRIRGRVLLDEIPEILKAKGLASSRSPTGSEDLREAVLATHDEYQKSLEKVQHIACVIELLKSKARAIQMAYESVKKILSGVNSLEMSANPNLLGSTGEGEAGSDDEYNGFGKATY